MDESPEITAPGTDTRTGTRTRTRTGDPCPTATDDAWWDTAALVGHYLAGSGDPFTVDPAAMLAALPDLRAAVDGVLATHAGEASFVTSWQDTGARPDLRYRVWGGTDPASGRAVFHLDVHRPSVFGTPRPGSGRGADFVVTGTHRFVR